MSERSRSDSRPSAGDHFEREIVAAEIGKRACLDHQARFSSSVGRSAVRVARSTASARSGLWFIR